MTNLPDLDIERGYRDKPRLSTPGHGGPRPGAGRKKASDKGESLQTKESANAVLVKSRAKREMYRAGLAELEYKQKSGELIPAEEVTAAWVERVQIAKGRLLALPSRVAPRVLGLTELRAIEQIVREAVVETLEELAQDASSA